MLTIHTTQSNSSHKIRLDGALDISTIDILNENIQKLERISSLEIDFSGLKFIDSTGIGAILKLIYESQTQGFVLHFQGMDENIKDIFETVGVFRVLEALQRGVV